MSKGCKIGDYLLSKMPYHIVLPLKGIVVSIEIRYVYNIYFTRYRTYV